ncbi:MAG: hypothetical protein U9Q66_00580 [Patescibacteria group bacterium]|nr:hypothetical protein [Patescibacteria group bacterium]
MNNLFKRLTNSFLILAIFAMYFPTDAEAKRRSSSWGKSSYKKSSRSSSKSSGFFSKKKKSKSTSSSWGWGGSKKKTTTASKSKPKPKPNNSSYNGNTQKAKDSRTRQAELKKKREALKAKKATANNTATKPKTTSGFGSTVKKGQTTTRTGKTVTGNKFDQKRNKTITKKRNKKAYANYKKDKLKFKGDRKVNSSGKTVRKPVTKVTTKQRTVYKTRYITRTRSNSYYGRNSYYDRRSSYYGGYHHRPYVYNYSSSFGMWDGLFLWALLSNNNHGSQHIYHHQSDPGVQQWMATAREEAKENAELRAQLNKMDADIARMKSEGVKVDEAYLPEDVDPDIAFDPDFVEQNSDMFYDDDLTNLDALDKQLHPSNFN